jgi:hypothetical protein
MNDIFVLIHSPLVGPFTWGLVAGELRQDGVDVVLPSLTDDEHSRAPFWQQHAASVARALTHIPVNRALILVGHSGAGPILPAIRSMIARPVAGYLFVDAGIPIDGASHLDLRALESPEMAQQFRQALAAGERFPTWNEQDLSGIIPDPERRRSLLAELHPRALAFFEEPIPVFDGWPDVPCGYLLFTPTYDVFAERARREGWAYRQMDAGHFHMLVDSKAVADAIMNLVARMG